MSGSINTVASSLSGYWAFRRVSIFDSNSRSYLSSFFGIAASTDDPLAISSPALRTITSMLKFGAFTAVPPAWVGMLRSKMVMCVNTAVMSRKITRTVRMSIIGIRFNTRMMSVSNDSAFGLLRYRLDIFSSDSIGASQNLRSLKLALAKSGNSIDRLDRCHFQAVHDMTGCRCQARVKQQKRDRGHQTKCSA